MMIAREEAESICRFYEHGKVCDRIKWKALWKVLRMYDVGGELLNNVGSMYVDILF